VCVPYYSLPEFPSYCNVVSNHRVVLRDVLLCNPSNFHVLGGVQYDPHLETLEYINCQPRVRNSIAKEITLHEDVRILFRTRFFRLDGSSDEFVTGYYVVDHAESDKICRDAPVIRASKARFVSAEDCIKITRVMERTGAYRSCFSTENPKWKKYLLRWTKEIEGREDLTPEYTQEIQKLKTIYRDNEHPGSVFYKFCQGCQNEEHICFLTRRRKHGSLPRFPGHWE